MTVADAKNRQNARFRLREIQVRQAAVARAYERATSAADDAEREHAAAVARAEQSRDAARRHRAVALAALAAAVRDQETCAAIAGVAVSDVRHAVKEVPADEVERFLKKVPVRARRQRTEPRTTATTPPQSATFRAG